MSIFSLKIKSTYCKNDERNYKIMKKEDFRYEDLEKYINNKYVFEDKEYLLLISEEIFNEDAIRYANGIIKKISKGERFYIELFIRKRIKKIL
mgnify:CR=1 FL=1